MVTKLGRWISLASKDQREELADSAGISVEYLRMMGYAHRENPKIRLAFKLCDALEGINRRNNRINPKLPAVTMRDLAEATRRDI